MPSLRKTDPESKIGRCRAGQMCSSLEDCTTEWAQLPGQPREDLVGSPCPSAHSAQRTSPEGARKTRVGLGCPVVLRLLFPISYSSPAETNLLHLWIESWLLETPQAGRHDPWCGILAKAKVPKQKKEASAEIQRRTCDLCSTTGGYFLGPSRLWHLYLARVQNLNSLYCVQSGGALHSSKVFLKLPATGWLLYMALKFS